MASLVAVVEDRGEHGEADQVGQREHERDEPLVAEVAEHADRDRSTRSGSAVAGGGASPSTAGKSIALTTVTAASSFGFLTSNGRLRSRCHAC